MSARRSARHARPPEAARGPRRMAGPEPANGPAGLYAAPPPRAGFDPLADPVAITERSVLGDQIRLPATWCEIAGCGAGFTDPAALGEVDNRARAIVAGWAADAAGRLACPACQQRYHLAPPRRAPGREPAEGAAWPEGAARPEGAASRSGQSPVVGPPPPAGQSRRREPRWPSLLTALASHHHGWTTPPNASR